MLICFVENAFKHGTSTIERSFVDVSMKVRDGKMDFYVKNSMPEKKPDVVSTRIGIRNTTERLKLQYGSNYTLDIQENGIFSVHLQLQLKRL